MQTFIIVTLNDTTDLIGLFVSWEFCQGLFHSIQCSIPYIKAQDDPFSCLVNELEAVV